MLGIRASGTKRMRLARAGSEEEGKRMPFERGRSKTGGRKAGVANRFTGSIREAVLITYDAIGGHTAFTKWAKENQTEYYKLASKLIPVEVKTTRDLEINVIIHRDPKPARQATVLDAPAALLTDSTDHE